MKSTVMVLVSAMVFCGCTSLRYSGKYGDGAKYSGIGGANTYRKFYIRKIEGDGAFASAASMSQKYPELFNRYPKDGDVAVDVYAKKIGTEDGGGWTFVFAFLYSIIPTWVWNENMYSVEISVDGDADLVPATTCCYAHDFKMSIFSPLGLIPFGDKEGYQRNESTSGLMTTSLNFADVLEDVMAACIAQQLKTHALDKLTIPDIEF